MAIASARKNSKLISTLLNVTLSPMDPTAPKEKEQNFKQRLYWKRPEAVAITDPDGGVMFLMSGPDVKTIFAATFLPGYSHGFAAVPFA
ncbi:hypothetical protein FLX56_04180 [Synechococcus moorigangaii CMS01]|nr:hypothetical protein [Synechococcus moorigangaii CMS01]